MHLDWQGNEFPSAIKIVVHQWFSWLHRGVFFVRGIEFRITGFVCHLNKLIQVAFHGCLCQLMVFNRLVIGDWSIDFLRDVASFLSREISSGQMFHDSFRYFFYRIGNYMSYINAHDSTFNNAFFNALANDFLSHHLLMFLVIAVFEIWPVSWHPASLPLGWSLKTKDRRYLDSLPQSLWHRKGYIDTSSHYWCFQGYRGLRQGEKPKSFEWKRHSAYDRDLWQLSNNR